MNKYYYLVSSLATLRFGEPEPLTLEGFMDECRKWLTGEDLKKLSMARLVLEEEKPADFKLIREWKRFNNSFKEEIARKRQSIKTGQVYKTSKELESVYSLRTPLESEIELERIRWDYLEREGIFYYFDLNSLVIYFLKLQILERLSSFDKDKGEKKFDAYEQAIRQGSGR